MLLGNEWSFMFGDEVSGEGVQWGKNKQNLLVLDQTANMMQWKTFSEYFIKFSRIYQNLLK
jgi:hypothetical protein